MRNLMIFTRHLVMFGNQIEKNEVGRACSTYGGEERCIQGFGGETWVKETIWENQALMGG